jgi:hypothetical protein
MRDKNAGPIDKEPKEPKSPPPNPSPPTIIVPPPPPAPQVLGTSGNDTGEISYGYDGDTKAT